MKYIRNFKDHINEMSVQKDWFKKHSEHRLSQLPINKKYSKKDLPSITFKKIDNKDYNALYKEDVVAYVGLQHYVKAGVITLKIVKNINLSFIALLIVKIVRNLKSLGLKRKDIYFLFETSVFEYVSLKHKIIEEIDKIDKSKNYFIKSSFLVNSKDKKLKKLYGSNADEIRNTLKKIELEDINFEKIINFEDSLEYYIFLDPAYGQLIFNYMESDPEEFTAADFEDLDTFINLKEPFITVNRFSGEVNTGNLPSIMRGVGLGYKIYKTVIMDSGFAKTSSTSPLALQVWKKLIQDKDFYHILFLGNHIGIIPKDLKRENVIDAFNILTRNSTIVEMDKELKKFPETQIN